MRARAARVPAWALACLIASGCGAPRTVRLPEWGEAQEAQVVQEVERFASANRLGPISVAILRGDSLVFARAVGDSSGEPRPAGFGLGELERQLLAAASLSQADSGHIALDAPLPLARANPNVQAPTLRELLHQVSGLASRDSTGAWVAEHRPRERWSESRAHGDAVAEQLEASTGRPAAALMAEAWGRAGLRVAGTPPRGGMTASAPELARWARALEQGAVVSRERYAEMTRLFALRDDREWPYGMGLELQTFEGRAKVMHAGTSSGSTVVLARYPQDDVSIAVAVPVAEVWALPALERRIARRLFGAPDAVPPEQPVKPGDLERSQGDFTCGSLAFELRSEGGRLHLTVLSHERVPEPVVLARVELTHVGGGRFIDAHEPDAVHVWIKRGAGPAPEIVVGWFGLPCQALRRNGAGASE